MEQPEEEAVQAETEAEVADQPEVTEEPEVAAEPDAEVVTEESLLSLKKVELVEMAESAGLSISGTKAELAARIIAGPQEEEEPEVAPQPEPEPKPVPEPPIAVPAAPVGMPQPPPVAARAVDPMDAAFDGGNEIPLAEANAVTGRPTAPQIPKIPKIPKMPHIAEENAALESPANNGFWPWPQQEEWSNRDVAMKIKEAMEAAKSRDVAQVTVLLDEVGPHLGERTKLLYPIGALLQRIGRASAVDRMIAAAVEAQPDDQDVQIAKSKLRP